MSSPHTTSQEARIVRPAPDEYAPYYERYISLVPDGDIVETLAANGAKTLIELQALTEEQGDLRYEPGKWSVRQMIGHVSDTERIFSYRALRIGRGDTTALPGFEQDDYARVAGYDRLTIQHVVREFEAVRLATLALLDGFDAAAWARRGTASGHGVSVRALAWMIAGHELYHRQLLNQKYLGK